MGLEDLNKTCQFCGKEFHSCSACNHIYQWEEDYCSEDCWRKSPTYEWNKNQILKMLVASKKDIMELSNFIFFFHETEDIDIKTYLYDKDIQEAWYNMFTSR